MQIWQNHPDIILADKAQWNITWDSLRALNLVSQLCEVVSSAAANDASSNYDNLFIHPKGGKQDTENWKLNIY